MSDLRDSTANEPWPVGTLDSGLPEGDSAVFVSAKSFEEQFDENIHDALNVDLWRLGADLDQEYRRIEREVREAEKLETTKEKQIRDEILPKLVELPKMPRNAGMHTAAPDEIAKVQRGLLFNGAVEACDGAVQIHETLPLTIYQIGISLVSYRGDQGTWGQRLFRHDLRQKGVDIQEWLEWRAKRDSAAGKLGQDRIGELMQKAILHYAERAILLRRSKAKWRLGHGNPMPYDLLTGGGNLELMVLATATLRQLIETHQRFVFVAGEPREALYRTIGQALRPMEYAIIGLLDEQIENWLHQERFKDGVSVKLPWDDESIAPSEWIPRVIERVASKVVVGLFRPTLLSPAQLFYAHVDHSEIAALIALADCMFKEHGTSMLLEMAHHVCTSVFGESLEALAESAYAAAGAHGRLMGRRFHRIH